MRVEFRAALSRMLGSWTLILLITACSNYRPPAPEPVVRPQPVNAALIRGQTDLPDEALLDIGLVVFDSGTPQDVEQRTRNTIFPQLRRAEIRYVPYTLRNTLFEANLWGAVRLLPEPDPTAEVMVEGTILRSDGIELSLKIRAWDATGRVWIDRTYADVAGQADYNDRSADAYDPFQDMYNQIANDLHLFRNTLSQDQQREIINVSAMRYAEELAPQAYSGYLADKGDGTVNIARLPARDDPMLARIMRVRESEYLFIDTVDEQYGLFYANVRKSYRLWRQYAYEQTTALEKLILSERRINRGAPRTFNGMKLAYEDYRETKYQQESLRELSDSFDTAVSPTVTGLEGEVVKLNGTMKTQYAEWRQLLRSLFELEAGGNAGLR